MKRDSFIFYKSFYNSIKELDSKDQVRIYDAIFQYQFEDKEIELKGVCKSIFTLIIPQLEANNKRYENGKKGGRPKNQNKTELKPKQNLELTKKQPNVNVNVNDNDNVNGNDTTTSSIYDYLENIFGRSLYEPEYEIVETWEDNDLTKYAINQAVLNGAFNIKYIDKILFSYKKNNITTVQQAQMEEENFRKSKTKKYGRQQTADDLDEMFKDWGDEDEEE